MYFYTLNAADGFYVDDGGEVCLLFIGKLSSIASNVGRSHDLSIFSLLYGVIMLIHCLRYSLILSIVTYAALSPVVI